MALFRKSKTDLCDTILQGVLKEKRYHEMGKAGEGGIAQVTSCFDTYLNRIVAVKHLKDSARSNDDLVRSFINEVKLIGYLDHPGIISIFDTFVFEENKLSYSMKFIEGYSLAAEIESMKSACAPASRIAQCIRIFPKLCEALAYVHDKGVIHLDLKPDNIMLGSYGQIYVMDWGNARLFDERPFSEYIRAFSGDAETAKFQKERDGIVMGTPGYMSPEQTNSERSELGPGSDIFSAGIILYEFLAGVHPFEGSDVEEILDNVRELTPPPPHEINPDIPRRLSALCMKMIDKNKSVRYQSFHDVLDDIREFSDSGQAFATRDFAPGETIFAEGDIGEFAFIIVSGKVQVAKQFDGETQVLAELGKGEIAGELAIFSKQARSATVTALEPTRIRIMNRQDVELEMEKLSPWVGNMITSLSLRFNSLNNKILQLAAQQPGSGLNTEIP